VLALIDLRELGLMRYRTVEAFFGVRAHLFDCGGLERLYYVFNALQSEVCRDIGSLESSRSQKRADYTY
jgi:hypothetical protein